MNKFLIAVYAIGALANLVLFFTNDYDIDKLVIAVLFVTLILDSVDDMQREAHR